MLEEVSNVAGASLPTLSMNEDREGTAFDSQYFHSKGSNHSFRTWMNPHWYKCRCDISIRSTT